ncbi:hypothetical protein EDC02_6125 [Micromonospora sp. Llam0]|uniref:DUF6879 family protein n=1 Tax=Micromonospora sp. Llam0 TaxID=2485143 RepID=UPI000F46C234|nr:DUF6879 family protein [Micromonospora sp. Llam0]ROO51253.1 hypothetical protein EDC02_6125 [Micromonospora sp. Llam0]
MTRSFTSLDDDEFNQLFRDFRYTAYRLETLQRYDVSYEQDEFTRFLAGERRGEFPGIAAWCDTVRAAVSAGKRMHRVHVVTEPLSDYVRFECGWAYEHTVEAGEDVRLIVVAGNDWPAALPHYDYWLFDSSQLVAMYYDEEGRFVSGELISDPAKIVQTNLWRDAAVSASMPYRTYADRLQPSPP